MMNCLDCLKKNREVVFYVGGLATAYLGKKLLSSSKVRTACVSTLAKGMTLQKDVESYVQNIKDEAQDLCYDAAAEAAATEETDAE
jgi:hypothetical protein